MEFTSEAPSRQPASLFDLVNAVNVVLKRFGQREDRRDIFEDKWSVSEKIESLMKALTERASIRFSELFEGVTSRSEVVVTFLALLELIRLKQITALQNEPFGEIEIARSNPQAVETPKADASASAPAPEPIAPSPSAAPPDAPSSL